MDSADPVLMSLIILAFSMVGACLGSFAGAVAYRIAHQKSWIIDKNYSSGVSQPARSSCPSCHHQLSIFDLIPVLSWVCLRGKCRYCEEPISVRYPAIELGGAIALVAFGLSGSGMISLAVFMITLPFCLVFCLLLLQHSKVPFYIYGLFFINLFVFLYTTIWGNKGL